MSKEPLAEPVNYDPLPMVGVNTGTRYPVPFSASEVGEAAFERPRPEFLTRDPEPWALLSRSGRFLLRTAAPVTMGRLTSEWAPQPGFEG